jgi:PAS domain-containing protein
MDQGEFVERIYDDNKLFIASNKHFAAAKNSLGRDGQLRLVVSKSHERRIVKNTLFGESLESQALLESHDAILIRRFGSGRIVSWNRGAHKLYGWSNRRHGSGLESWSKREKTAQNFWLRVTGRYANGSTGAPWKS